MKKSILLLLASASIAAAIPTPTPTATPGLSPPDILPGTCTGPVVINQNIQVGKITPSDDCTFQTSTAANIGDELTIVVTTSGTTSFTMTFDSHFLATGTLTTGTVSGAKFTVTFKCITQSDTSATWIEVARSGPNEPIIGVAVSDETTAITTGTAKVTFRSPSTFVVTDIRASLTTESSSGTPTFDIKENGTTILSTALTIDEGEKTSTTASTPLVISSPSIVDDAEITVDITDAGTGATGVKILFYGHP